MNQERFLNSVQELSQIGWAEDFGLTRVAFSDQFIAGRDYIAQLMSTAGMQVRIDSVGNIFGRYTNKTSSDKVLLTGSHIDSVRGGGIHDGFLGVLSSIEAARSLYETGHLLNTLEVVGFNAEEGGPLGGTFGSRSFCGDFTQIPTTDILDGYAISKDSIYAAQADMKQYKAFVELHIEQGPVLWRNNIDIGIPTAIVGITRYKITVDGQANHAGTTPMNERQDALREAARLITTWYETIDTLSETNFVCNIGRINLVPNEPAVVPGKAELVLEMRSTDPAVITMLTDLFSKLLQNSSLQTDMQKIIDKPPVSLNATMQQMLYKICEYNQLNYIYMPSGAGHDASPIALKMPTAMLFIPSVDGVSHSPKEACSESSMLIGVKVLKDMLSELDRTQL